MPTEWNKFYLPGKCSIGGRSPTYCNEAAVFGYGTV